jgi:uncharacterized membrane protein
MPILTYNEGWMLYNCFLAILALGFGYFFLISQNHIVKIAFGILWLLFFPNTIYIFTDLEHFIDQWPLLSWTFRIPLFLQYALLEIIGFVTFAFGLYPFEQILLLQKKLKKHKIAALIIFNFLIAFAMVLGRVERINSWEVFTDPLKVLNSALHVFFSSKLLGLVFLFGILCNCFYFLFRDRILRLMRKYLQVLD